MESFWALNNSNSTVGGTGATANQSSSAEILLVTSLNGSDISGFLANVTNSTFPASQTDSEVLRDTFVYYGSAIILILLIFSWARLRFPRAFNLRKSNKEEHADYFHQVSPVPSDLQSDLANEQFGFFSWAWKLFFISDDKIMNECGLDALCFIRLCTMGFRLSLIGIVNSIWLMPVYKTATEKTVEDQVRDIFSEITTGNIPAQSSRLIAPVVASYVMFGSAMLMVLKEFKWFTKMRHKFVMKRIPRNYAVYIQNIPTGLRSNKAISKFFEKSIVGVRVLEAHVVQRTNHLKSKVKKRDDCIMKLEHAVAVLDENKKRPTHKVMVAPVPGALGCGKEVDSIDYYTEELKKLNQDIFEHINILREMASEQPDDQVYESDDEDPKFFPFADNSDFLVHVARKTKDVLKYAAQDPSAFAPKTAGLVGGATKKAVQVVLPDDGKYARIRSLSWKNISTRTDVKSPANFGHLLDLF
jgi:hypothetical protein